MGKIHSLQLEESKLIQAIQDLQRQLPLANSPEQTVEIQSCLLILFDNLESLKCDS